MKPNKPKPPKPPLGRRIIEGTIGECPKCHSSLYVKWLFFKTDKCIHPECENYFNSESEQRKRKIRKII